MLLFIDDDRLVAVDVALDIVVGEIVSVFNGSIGGPVAGVC